MNDSPMRVYFDYNATTPFRPKSLDVVARVTRDRSATHRAFIISANRRRRLWTTRDRPSPRWSTPIRRRSCSRAAAPKSDNFAIRGAAEALEPTRPPSSDCERASSTRRCSTRCKALARRGWRTTLVPVDQTGIVSPDRLRAVIDRRHGARVGDARQQRDRHDPADCRAGRDRARARRADAHRRRAVGGQDSGRRARARRRSAVAVGAQVQRAQGRRRAVDQARHADAADPDRRQARAQPARRHRERRRRSPGMGVAAPLAAGKMAGEAVRVGALRDRLEAGILARGARHRGQRRPDCARAEHDEYQLRARRGREPADRARSRGHRGVDRIGLLVWHARAVARAEGDGASRRTGRRTRCASASGCFRPTQKWIESSRCCRNSWRS